MGKIKRMRRYRCRACGHEWGLFEQFFHPICPKCSSNKCKRLYEPKVKTPKSKKKRGGPRKTPRIATKRVGVRGATKVSKLGFTDYQEYLNSDLWKEIRQKVLDRDRQRCVICGGSAKQVHHQDYSMQTLQGQDLTHLYSVCVSCHKRVEFFRDGSKRDFREVQAVFCFLLDESPGNITEIDIESLDLPLRTL